MDSDKDDQAPDLPIPPALHSRADDEPEAEEEAGAVIIPFPSPDELRRRRRSSGRPWLRP